MKPAWTAAAAVAAVAAVAVVVGEAAVGGEIAKTVSATRAWSKRATSRELNLAHAGGDASVFGASLCVPSQTSAASLAGRAGRLLLLLARECCACEGKRDLESCRERLPLPHLPRLLLFRQGVVESRRCCPYDTSPAQLSVSETVGSEVGGCAGEGRLQLDDDTFCRSWGWGAHLLSTTVCTAANWPRSCAVERARNGEREMTVTGSSSETLGATRLRGVGRGYRDRSAVV